MRGIFLALALAALPPASEGGQIAAAEAALKSASPDAVEKNALAIAGPRAAREKGTLVLVLDGGKHLTLSDTGCGHEEEGC
ncbi:MAG TPA: hypothetical protein VFV07_05875, partial [Rhizomicrobium sp.]|nr:hypothetical protein [Rhizomicrobium sp.]